MKEKIKAMISSITGTAPLIDAKRLMLVMLLLLTFVGGAKADEVTVCNGTTSNNYIPVYGVYADTQGCTSEFIIPSTTEGMNEMIGATISKLTFYLDSPADEAWTSTFQVYIDEVDNTTLSSIVGPSACTVVYTGTLDASGSTMEIVFDTPYTYEGGNLLIGTYVQTNTSVYTTAYFYGVEAQRAGYHHHSSTNSAQNFIPKTTFTYTHSSGPVYYKPNTLTLDDVTATTATISWTAPTTTETITGYAYQYKKASDGDDAWSTEATVTTASASLSGLTANTAYIFRVKTLYGTNESLFATLTFFTECGAITTFPWSEDFESYSTGNFVNPCWENEHIEGSGNKIFTISTNTNSTNSTHQLQLPDQSDGTMTKLRLPEMTLPQGKNYQFTLDVYRNSNYSDKTGEGIRVFASADGNITGATELAFIPRVYSVASGDIPVESAAGWYTYELPIPMSGTCYIILRGESKWGAATYMDNFAVEEVPTCLRPSGLIASNINAHDVTLNWNLKDDTQTAWDVQVATNAAFSENVRLLENVNIHENYVLSGLTAETNYYVRVCANCGGGDVSGWSNTVSFRTLISCPAPTNLTCSAYTSTTATLKWKENGTATNWVLQYGTDETFADGNYTEENVSGTPATILNGLTAETFYYARVKAKNSEEDQSLWSTVIRFQPAATIMVTVNDGTETNYYTPFPGGYIEYGSINRSQFIIPATDLQDDIVPGSTIKRMTFYTSSEYDTNWGNAQYTVSLKEVNITTFSSNAFDTSDLTAVYTGTVSLVNNKMEIFFSTGFNYNGGNLLVDFELTGNSSSSLSRGWCGVKGSGNNAVIAYKYKRPGQDGATQEGPSRSSFMPKVTFHYLQEAVSCERPTSVTVGNVTGLSATVTWEGDGDCWNLEYKTASAETWTAVTGLTAKSYELTSLTSNAAYEVRVQTDCGGGDVSTWRKASFVTLASIPFAEGFASTSEPFGWSKYAGLLSDVMNGTASLTSTTSGFGFGTNNGVFDRHAYINIYYNDRKYWLVTPSMVMENNVQLTFDLALTYYSGTLITPQTTGTDDKFVVLISTDNGNTWSVLRQWDNAGSAYVYNNITCSATGQMVAIDLSSYAGQTVNVAFYGESTEYNADNYLHIDNVSIDYIPSCQRPTDLAVSNITATSAELSWTANGSETAWTVYYKKSSEESYTSVAVSTNTYALGGLDAGTYYKFYVTANCSATDESDPSSVYAFYTDCATITKYPWTENFDSYTGVTSGSANNLPICWNYINTCSDYSYRGYPVVYDYSNDSRSGNNHLYFSSDVDEDPKDQYAILPEMESLSGKRIKLYARKGGPNCNATFSVGIMTDPTDATTFTEIATCTPASTTYEPFSVLFNTYTGTGTYIAIKMAAASGGTNREVCIDDITVEVIPACVEPSRLAASDLTGHTAVLSWINGEEGQNAWQICLNDDETNLINANSNPFTLTGLNIETTYTAKVRAYCSETDQSEWSDPVSFTTDIACPVPTGLVVSTVGPNFATLNWNSHADSWQLCINDDEEHPIDVTDKTYTLTELTNETDYTVKLRGYFGNDGYSSWTTNVNFTTLVSNPVPADMAVNNITSTAATVSWTGYGDNYKVKYRKRTFFPEGFEGGTMPNDWTIEGENQDAGKTWRVGVGDNSSSIGTHSGEKNALITHNDRNNQTYLITPAMDFSGLSDLTLSFWYVNREWSGDIDGLGVYYRVNGGEWNELWSTTEAHEEWTNQTVALTGLDANYQIGFKMTDEWGYGVGLDDIDIPNLVAHDWVKVADLTEKSTDITGLTPNTQYEYQVQSVKGDNTTDWSKSAFFTTPGLLELADNDSAKPDGEKNADLVSDNNGVKTDVTLAGRTLWKDGDWNTIVLPFSLSAEQIAASGLADADIRTLSSTEFSNGTLTLNFTPAAPAQGAVTSISAGVPYIIKWDGDGSSNLVSPTFTGVTISKTTDNVSTDYVDFKGTYSPVTYGSDNTSILFLGTNNTLYYPKAGASINAFRSYFELKNGLTAGAPNSSAPVLNFVLNFGDHELATGISTTNLTFATPHSDKSENFTNSDTWFTIDGRKLQSKPTKKGLYIHNGKKTLIK